MSTQKFQLHISGFKGGLNTEASALNVLPSELMEGSINVELLQNGEMRRRRGVDFVGANTAGEYLQTVRNSNVNAEGLYESPSAFFAKLTAPNGTTLERLVVDMNDKFLIYRTDKTSLSRLDTPDQTLTRNWTPFSTTITKSVDDQKFYGMQFAQSGNRVFFTGLKCHPGFLSVASDNTTLQITFIDVLIRDPNNKEPSTRVDASGTDTDWFECIEAHTASATNEPGTGDEWQRYWFQLDGKSPHDDVPAWVTTTAYTSTFIKRYDKYVDATITDTYPTAIAFYAGRLWLSGDPKNPDDILFSQVFINDGDLEKFHQYADSLAIITDADVDLVPDDGGVISLQGAGAVKDMADIGSALFIGSDKGVWQIKGQDQIFKATSFSSDRVLTEAILGAGAMLNADNTLFVFGENNIWRADFKDTSSSTVAGLASFSSFSENRLASFYSNIPATNKEAAWPVYNPTDRKVYWFFNESATSYDLSYGAKNQPGYFTNVMVMDVRTVNVNTESQLDEQRILKGAFYLYELADTGSTEQPYIAFPFIAPDIGIADKNVTSGSGTDNVQSGSGTNEVVAVGGTQAGSAVFFIAMQRVNPSGNAINIKAAFSTLKSNNLTDWASDTTYTTSVTTKAITGFQTMGDVLHKKGMTYIFFVFKRVETGTLVGDVDTNQGGCFIRTAWNWAGNASSNLYGAQFQVYYPDRWGLSLTTGVETHDHVWWKHRVRGRGHVVQVIFENDGNKDFHLVGWSQQFHGKLD